MWPPSPSVEDEAASLAREHGLDAAIHSLKSETIPPADSRGAVDQYPIIVDNTSTGDKAHKKETELKRPGKVHADGHSSDESTGPATPPHPNSDKRHVFIAPPSIPVPTLSSDSSVKPRSKSTTRVGGNTTPRGRPQISRIHTDIGSDLQEMITGNRRAPSPYSYQATPASTEKPSADGFSKQKTSLLSPVSATQQQNTHEFNNRRAQSAHPDKRSSLIDHSDSENKSSSSKQRSQSRVDRKRSYYSSGEEAALRSRPNNSSFDRAKAERNPPPEKRPSPGHRPAMGNITPPITPGRTRESPYASAAEDSDRHREIASRRSERKFSRDSPYTSSAEESRTHRSAEARSGVASVPDTSTSRRERPHLDLSDQRRLHVDEKVREKLEDYSQRRGHDRGRHDPDTPVSARTPRSMEEYFEKALEENRKRHSKHSTHSHHSASTSPFVSPPSSPPRTPRSERKSRDYFEMGSASALASKQRSRPPSVDENAHKEHKLHTSLLGAATLGASIAAKTKPNLTRSSTISQEASSSGSQSQLASGQRSRRPSPVREEPKPASRAGSITGSGDQSVHRTINHPLREERLVSRDGVHLAMPAGHPPPLQRASSYSSALEQPSSRPGSSYRNFSAGGPGIHPPTAGLAPTQAPPSLARMTHSSPTSSDRVPSLSTFVPPPQRLIALPLCPTLNPLAGNLPWHTIQGLKGFDVCPSCMATLGNSLFRDHLVPSPHRPPTELVYCTMMKPWIRIAMIKSLKEGKANVALIRDLNHLPPEVIPCSGNKSDTRRWYHMIDPSTNRPVPNIDVCTACVRAVETTFPELWSEKLFERPKDKLSQVKTCTFNASSKHFHDIINELDKLAGYSMKKDLRKRDIQTFIDFVRSTTRYTECSKDTMLATRAWHFMPELPEFTICESCFHQVVWPLKDLPLARDVSKLKQIVPVLRQEQQVPGISCQLYSERMRGVFREAVSENGFAKLRDAARIRYDMEHRLQELQRLYEQDQRSGMDRRADIERNVTKWKSYE